MTAWVLVAAPKSMPLAGTPPITPGSAVSVMRSMIFSSLAIAATPSGMPMPRLTTLLAFSSKAARRAMILRSLIAIGGSEPARRPDLAAEGGIVLRAEGLPVVLGLGDDDAVDQNARYLHLARVEAAALGDALDLGDDDAARIVRRHRDGERLERQRLLFHGEIAVGVAGGGADDPDVDRESLVG